jgi:hypothetical protein
LIDVITPIAPAAEYAEQYVDSQVGTLPEL